MSRLVSSFGRLFQLFLLCCFFLVFVDCKDLNRRVIVEINPYKADLGLGKNWQLPKRDNGDTVDIQDVVLQYKIINGFPYDPSGTSIVVIIALFPDGKTTGLCTGTFIANQVVLTAAHCIHESSANGGWGTFKGVYIFVPSDNPYSDEDGIVDLTLFSLANGAYGNPKYNGRAIVNDIAFITSPNSYTQFLMPVDIVTDFGSDVNRTVYVCGYGNTQRPDLEGKDSFFCLEGNIRPGTECIKLLDPTVSGGLDKGQVCELYKNGSACNGDSGGPTVALVPNPFLNGTSPNPFNATGQDIPVQIGITSFGAQGCTLPFTVFTRVYQYGPTILDVICTVQGTSNEVCKFYTGYSDQLAKDPLRNVPFSSLATATLMNTGTVRPTSTGTLKPTATSSKTAIITSTVVATSTRTIVPTPTSHATRNLIGFVVAIMFI